MPSAWTIVVIRFDLSNTGSAHSAPARVSNRTGTKSSMPACEAMCPPAVRRSDKSSAIAAHQTEQCRRHKQLKRDHCGYGITRQTEHRLAVRHRQDRRLAGVHRDTMHQHTWLAQTADHPRYDD